jgi:hypothetical protein
MEVSFIRVLVAFLPDDSSYFRRIGVGNSRPDRLAVALNDPKVGWNFLRSLIEDKLEFPLGLDHPQLQRANAYLRGAADDSVEEAMSLAHPENTTKRNILKGLLISTDVTLVEIADWMSFSLEAAQIYSELFFNVRDRRNEPGYITKILYPDGIQINSGCDSEELLMLRAGAWHGAKGLIELVNVKPPLQVGSLAELHEKLESATLRAALKSIQYNGGSLKTPLMNLAKALMVAQKRDRVEPFSGDEIEGLGGVSIKFAVLETLQQQMSDPGATREGYDLTFQKMVGPGSKNNHVKPSNAPEP